MNVNKKLMYGAFLIAFFSISILSAQNLQVSLGADQTICKGSYAQLRANVSGGTPPYTYKWTPDEELTSANSQLMVATPSKSTVFKLIVTDSKGQSVKDEVKIDLNSRPEISAFGYYDIASGETVQLNTKIIGGTPPYSYTWRPTHGISDLSSQSPKVKPSISTAYNMVVRDSKGCSDTKQIMVQIEPTLHSALKAKAQKK